MTDEPSQAELFDAEVLTQKWYVKPDDLIGGWCVMNCDKPPSQADFRKGEYEIGCFMTKRIAQEMVMGHHLCREKYDRKESPDG